VKIRDNRELASLYLLEEQNRSPFTFLLELYRNGSDFISGINLARDDQKIFGVVALCYIKEASQILRHELIAPHSTILGLSSSRNWWLQ
jgi:hypothetical protein